MPISKKNRSPSRCSIVCLPLEDIASSPVQPRRSFDRSGLEELAASIREYGILNPLTVRRRRGKYELIAGERRLRAARLAGLSEVPCIVLDVNMEDSGLIALVENLQRRDLDIVDEAEGIARMIRCFGISQEETARRLGKSQPAIANKLRLLKLPPDVLQLLRGESLTERHGRALLRLPTPELQRRALDIIVSKGLTVSATDALVEQILKTGLVSDDVPPEQDRKNLFVLKDVRVFMNTLARSLNLMKKGGIDAGIEKTETETELILKISIPKS